MKKTTIFFIALAMICLSSKAQTTYQIIAWDNYANFGHVPYCSCDSVKCVPPAGVTDIHWNPAATQHGDTLVLPSTFNGGIACYWNGGDKVILIHPIAAPTPPVINDQTICGIATVLLDAANTSTYGFTHYAWSNGATSQTILVGAGTYTVTISTGCGSPITESCTITENNPNKPNLGPDITPCPGSIVSLDPGTGYSNYVWTPGNIIDTILYPSTSGMYIVQTTNTDNECIDRDTIIVNFQIPYTEQRICFVSKGFTSNKNEITFDATPGEMILYYNIKKESSVSGVYTLIKKIPHTDNGIINIVDSTDNGTIQYTYNITINDLCGNESSLGGKVKPIFSTLSVNELGTYNMHLVQYYDENDPTVPMTTYIYSGNDLPLTLRDSIAGGVSDYVVPSNNSDTIFAAAIILPCGNNKSMSIAYSNRVTKNSATIIQETTNTIDFTVYPNPAIDRISIQSNENILLVTVTDLAGRIILSSNEKNINISTVSSGTYLIKATTSTRKTGYQKLIKQ